MAGTRVEHDTFANLPLSIEYRRGEIRTGTGADGKPWARKMHADYGYIRGTKGLDGEHLDVYVGPSPEATEVYVIQQMKGPDFKKLDEQKFMLGFDSADDAKKIYLKHYPDPRILGSLKAISIEDFKEKAMDRTNHGKKIASFVDRFVELNMARAARGEPVLLGGAHGLKVAADAGRPLTEADRDKIKTKNFAIPETEKYPIHDESHARNALSRVRQFGTPEEKTKVYAAVAKKYPGLAERSSIEGVRAKSAADRTTQISDRVDDVGIGILAAPYAARGIANTLEKRPGRLGAIGKAARGVADHMHRHENKYELAGLSMVAPGVTHNVARGVEKGVDKAKKRLEKVASRYLHDFEYMTEAEKVAVLNFLARAAGRATRLPGAAREAISSIGQRGARAVQRRTQGVRGAFLQGRGESVTPSGTAWTKATQPIARPAALPNQYQRVGSAARASAPVHNAATRAPMSGSGPAKAVTAQPRVQGTNTRRASAAGSPASTPIPRKRVKNPTETPSPASAASAPGKPLLSGKAIAKGAVVGGLALGGYAAKKGIDTVAGLATPEDHGAMVYPSATRPVY